MGRLTIGVLALQGAFAKHAEMLKRLGAEVIEVRKPEDLDRCDGLIIPGGESTTIMRQIKFIKLEESLKSFAQKKNIFGTCAGLILISKEILGNTMKPFGLIDMSVERNAFGRQADSFSREVLISTDAKTAKPYRAFFIRAPRIRHIGSDVKVLAAIDGEPILVQQGNHLAATFHPELTDDPAIHAYFLKLVTDKVRFFRQQKTSSS